MNKRLGLIGGLGFGAGAMFLLDPDRGRRRRAIARDKLVSQLHRTSSGVDIAARDLAHRTQGLAARAKSRILDRVVDDAVLCARVRAKLGRLVSHPHAIEVTAEQGKVTLRGLSLADEIGPLLLALGSIRGVQAIENQLKSHRRDEKVPALQGGRPRAHRFELLQQSWSPSARIAVGAAGSLPLIAGLRRRDAAGYILSGIGLGMMVRAISNKDFKRFFGIGTEGMIKFHKTVDIDAPIDDVFRFWSDFDSFVQFLPKVMEVQAQGQNRSRWTVTGPAGIPIRWRAVTTRFEPGHLIAWRSEPGAWVRHEGLIHFQELEGSQGTRLELEFAYAPPAGVIGHRLARIFGADPKSQLDDALVRIKSLLERGPSPRLLKAAAGF